MKKHRQHLSHLWPSGSGPSPILYHSKRQVTLYAVSLLTLALSIFVAYMIFSDLEAFLAEFSTPLSGICWMVAMLVAGNAMLGCMLWLSGRYILRIQRVGEDTILIKTWSIVGMPKTRRYPVAILRTATFYKGVSNYRHAPIVIAPYSILKTPEGKKLVLDELQVFR